MECVSPSSASNNKNCLDLQRWSGLNLSSQLKHKPFALLASISAGDRRRMGIGLGLGVGPNSDGEGDEGVMGLENRF